MRVWLAAFQWLIWTIGVVIGIPTEFPNPQKEFKLCGRRNASFVCDPELILGGDADRLNQLALNFQRSSPCLCSDCKTGVSLGIFVRSSLSPEAVREYPDGKSVAEMLRKRWHLGKCNDDIVILLVTGMNISEYSMGPTVQDILPDETATQIMKNCKAHFTSGWYYQGLESVVTSFSDALLRMQKKKTDATSKKNLIIGLSLGLGVLLILILFAALLLQRRNKRRKRGCSDVYESVPTKSNHENFVNDKIKEYQLHRFHNQDNEEEEESEEDNNTLSTQFLKLKRQLSPVVEESDDNEGLKENSASLDKSLYSSQDIKRPLQVTEL